MLFSNIFFQNNIRHTFAGYELKFVRVKGKHDDQEVNHGLELKIPVSGSKNK